MPLTKPSHIQCRLKQAVWLGLFLCWAKKRPLGLFIYEFIISWHVGVHRYFCICIRNSFVQSSRRWQLGLSWLNFSFKWTGSFIGHTNLTYQHTQNVQYASNVLVFAVKYSRIKCIWKLLKLEFTYLLIRPPVWGKIRVCIWVTTWLTWCPNWLQGTPRITSPLAV